MEVDNNKNNNSSNSSSSSNIDVVINDCHLTWQKIFWTFFFIDSILQQHSEVGTWYLTDVKTEVLTGSVQRGACFNKVPKDYKIPAGEISYPAGRKL